MEIKNQKHLRAFKIKYFGATNTLPSRMKITDLRFKKSKYINRSYEHMNGRYDVIEYLENLKIKILYTAELSDNEDLVLTNNFEAQLK